MDLFSKKRLTFWIIILLVVFNAASIITLWWALLRRPPVPMPHPSVAAEDSNLRFLESELALNPEQVRQCGHFRREFFADAQRLTESLHTHRMTMTEMLFSQDPDTQKVDALADSIGRLHSGIEILRARHFLQMKNVCKGSQRERLHRLLQEANRMAVPLCDSCDTMLNVKEIQNRPPQPNKGETQ